MRLLENILPDKICKVINFKLNKNYIYEIRIRANKPIVINYMGKYKCIDENGITENKNSALRVNTIDIKNIILKAANYSIYAVNDQIKEGYLCINNGIRIGICGQIIIENNIIKTITNISSINIRIPHQILNCSLNTMPFITDNDKFLNTLVISPPGAGKTTYIRDVCFQLSQKKHIENILILDERNEIANIGNSNALCVGDYCDVLTNCTKMYGFTQGIRSMKPDIIVTDEISTEQDIKAIEYACSCGVNILASIHADSVADLKQKEQFKKCLQNRTFKRYIVFSNKNGPMTLEGIFDENLRCLCL